MKMRRSIGNARYSALLLLLLAAGAAACIKHSGVQFDITVLKVTPSNVAEEVGKKLEDTLGTTFDRNHDVEGVVRYSVKLPLGLNGGLHSIPFTKPCGQTFKERAEELWSNYAGGFDVGPLERAAFHIHRAARAAPPRGPPGARRDYWLGRSWIYPGLRHGDRQYSGGQPFRAGTCRL